MLVLKNLKKYHKGDFAGHFPYGFIFTMTTKTLLEKYNLIALLYQFSGVTNAIIINGVVLPKQYYNMTHTYQPSNVVENSSRCAEVDT